MLWRYFHNTKTKKIYFENPTIFWNFYQFYSNLNCRISSFAKMFKTNNTARVYPFRLSSFPRSCSSPKRKYFFLLKKKIKNKQKFPIGEKVMNTVETPLDLSAGICVVVVCDACYPLFSSNVVPLNIYCCCFCCSCCVCSWYCCCCYCC